MSESRGDYALNKSIKVEQLTNTTSTSTTHNHGHVLIYLYLMVISRAFHRVKCNDIHKNP